MTNLVPIFICGFEQRGGELRAVFADTQRDDLWWAYVAPIKVRNDRSLQTVAASAHIRITHGDRFAFADVLRAFGFSPATTIAKVDWSHVEGTPWYRFDIWASRAPETALRRAYDKSGGNVEVWEFAPRVVGGSDRLPALAAPKGQTKKSVGGLLGKLMERAL